MDQLNENSLYTNRSMGQFYGGGATSNDKKKIKMSLLKKMIQLVIKVLLRKIVFLNKKMKR